MHLWKVRASFTQAPFPLCWNAFYLICTHIGNIMNALAATRGSVSCPPSILCHADLRSRGLNHQPFNLIVLPHEPQLLPPVFPNLGLSLPRLFHTCHNETPHWKFYKYSDFFFSLCQKNPAPKQHSTYKERDCYERKAFRELFAQFVRKMKANGSGGDQVEVWKTKTIFRDSRLLDCKKGKTQICLR